MPSDAVPLVELKLAVVGVEGVIPVPNAGTFNGAVEGLGALPVVGVGVVVPPGFGFDLGSGTIVAMFPYLDLEGDCIPRGL